MDGEIGEKEYSSFMVNRGLSYFIDTVLIANEMNMRHHAGSRLQYLALINSVRKRKRFSKWHKATVNPDIEVIKQYYGYTDALAKEVLALFSANELTELKKRMYKGGKQKFRG